MTEVDYLRLQTSELAAHTRELVAANGHVRMAYAWYPKPGQIEVRYLTSRRAREPFLMWTVTPDGVTVPSLASEFPRLGWYEREMADLFGLTFAGHPEPKRLVLLDGVEVPCPPMSPDFPPSQKLEVTEHGSGMPELEGPDVQRLPWGPVRADVVESVELRFFYVGEHILHLHPQLFFKHRGIEKRFEGQTPQFGAVLAERVSGVGSFAHALAFCQAVEAASGCVVPDRAKLMRVVLAEMERLYNHLHYLGHLAETTTLKVGAAEGKYLEERFKQLNSRLTGSRFLRSLLTPGGLRRDFEPGNWLGAELARLEQEIDAYTTRLESTNSYLDRVITTGKLDWKMAYDQGATGPVWRASGSQQDLRQDHPYAGYDGLPLKVPARKEGDAHARAEVRIDEIAASLSLIRDALRTLPHGEVKTPCAPPAGSEGIGWAESPRGSVFYAVHFDDHSLLKRVKVKSPSFSNWRVFPLTVHESNMMDYAINEASFGMTVAGCDR